MKDRKVKEVLFKMSTSGREKVNGEGEGGKIY
jgi:hypothetical protein